MKIIKTIGSVLIAALILTPVLVHADLFIKQKQSTTTKKNQPAKEDIQTTWLTRDKARMDNLESSSIVRLDKNTVYILDNSKKTYIEIELGKNTGMSGMSDEDMAKMPAMLRNMMKPKISVTVTGETKKINDWNCAKYILSMGSTIGKIQSEIWATQDIKLNMEIYSNAFAAMAVSNPIYSGAIDDITRELKKIKGIQVFTTSTIDMKIKKVTSTSELLEYKEGTAPAGTFEIPAGYTKTEMGKSE